ncbi:MAG: aminopeptidase [Crocinitomicaceae bacterium]|nr:aminopeptidase [Crocinitomicaceae bacterium]|tara:strand:- start:92 stop:1972 length:1881 start_codon:yes stop_codon:yes gene_type:complete
MIRKCLTAFGMALVLFSCNTSENASETENPTETEKNMNFNDAHSFAQPQIATITHLNWDVVVNFDEKIIEGTATYDLKTAEGATEIILDTKNDLEVISVTADGEKANFTAGSFVEHLGNPLAIEITDQTKQISITYKTSPNAAALQWLSPQQTANKTAPFLFTQSQAILARSWIPVQDGPGMRFTYDAKVKVPEGLIALMSAKNPKEKSADGVYTFKMAQPIPAYLMALTVGDVEYTQLGAHTGIYAESSLTEKASYEFAEMEDMLVAAEKLYGKYQWEVYDMIILPPSFPFGGMENPRLTFATPTIIAGDRSLTALVAHELAHSWSGNLVTNATWDDFWLNEGFTVYFERRIMESLYGEEYAEMLADLGYQDLQQTVEDYMKKNQASDTHLKLNLKDRDPDDGMSDIAYEKGYFLLRLLEKSVGRKKFDAFLKNYFTQNAFQVMTTEAFLDYLKANLLSEEFYEELKVDAWVYGPGLPENCPVPESNRFEKVEAQITAWQGGKPAAELDTAGWSSHEWLHFVRSIPMNLDLKQMTELDNTFGFTNSGNSEILAAWFQHTIRNNYTVADPVVKNFLINVGRRKFLTPTYKAFKEAGKIEQAREIYAEARPNYHSVSTQTMDELLGE